MAERYLRRDKARAKRVGTHIYRHPAMTTGGFYRHMLHRVEIPQAHRWKESRQVKLATLRHEIGHHEVLQSKRDRVRSGKAGRKIMRNILALGVPKSQLKRVTQGELAGLGPYRYRHAIGMQAKYRDEMLAWKNAMRASKHANLGSRPYRDLESYAPNPGVHRQGVATLKRYQRMIRRPGFRVRFKK